MYVYYVGCMRLSYVHKRKLGRFNIAFGRNCLVAAIIPNRIKCLPLYETDKHIHSNIKFIVNIKILSIICIYKFVA